MSSIWSGIKKVGNGVATVGKTVGTAVRVGRTGIVFYAMYAALGLNPYTIAVPLITFII